MSANQNWSGPGYNCSSGSGANIVANTTSTPVCGLQSNNQTLLEQCCDGKKVQSWRCQLYCETPNMDIGTFARCINGVSGADATAYPPPSLFCLGGTSGIVTASVATDDDDDDDNSDSNNDDEDKPSAAFRTASIPRISSLLLLALLTAFFITPSSAILIPSLSSPSKRQNSDSSPSCTFTMSSNSTSIRRSLKVSSEQPCTDSAICGFTVRVKTDIDANNRTINENSAAEPQFDEFFDILQAMTGRMFPALSSLETEYSYAVPRGNSPGIRYYAVFTPFEWCATGTARNCPGVTDDLDEDEDMHIVACGPEFVDEEFEQITGLLNSVISG